MKVYGEDILDNKVVDKTLHTMQMKFDHVVTMIIESHDIDTMTIAELQESIESNVSRLLEKISKVSEEAQKSQVNLNNVVETSQSVESRGRDNFNNGGRGNFQRQRPRKLQRQRNGEISIKVETTIQGHLAEEEVEILLVVLTKEEAEVTITKVRQISKFSVNHELYKK